MGPGLSKACDTRSEGTQQAEQGSVGRQSQGVRQSPSLMYLMSLSSSGMLL